MVAPQPRIFEDVDSNLFLTVLWVDVSNEARFKGEKKSLKFSQQFYVIVCRYVVSSPIVID